VLALDSVNPQIAARLARALDRWRKFTPDRQLLMQQALQTVLNRARSPDVLEIVRKALAEASMEIPA
jgi:aminopeptidase N